MARALRAQEKEQADLVPVVPRDHGVHDEPSARSHRKDAELGRAHPRAARELEALGRASVEHDSLFGRAVVGELSRIPHRIEAVLVTRAGSTSPPLFQYPGDTLGPRARISSLPAARVGTKASSHPGAGRPITPARSIGKCTCVMSGDVSVDPHAATIVTLEPLVFWLIASSRSHVGCESAAAA